MTDNNSKKKSFSERAASNPTELHERFAKWIKEQTGIDADLKTVQLAVAFRMDFQASDANQVELKAKKKAAAQKEAERVAKRKAALEAELAKLSSAVVTETAEPVAEEAKEDEPEPVVETEENQSEAKAEPAQPAETATVETAPKPRSRRTRRTVGAEPVK